jgi:hypothetical protein
MDSFFQNQNIFLQPVTSIALVLVYLWSLVWKGLALWQASQNKEKIWFVCLLVINTAGILEIIYLFMISKEKLNLRELLKLSRK